jgi:hypothetical protein
MIAENRVRRQAENAQKWRRILASAWWLQAVPFVCMIAASGSLAMGSTGPHSDWDMFVIVRARRLYTARLGLLVTAKLLGRLRTKRMRDAPDHFCFNHIITTDNLASRHRSLFTAQAWSWLIPMYDPHAFLPRLRQANRWMSEYVSSPGDTEFRHRSVPISRALRVFRRGTEWALTTFVGDIVERAVCSWMVRRINREPVTHAQGGRIVADDRELEFHPHSFEAVALARYNASLVALGLGQFAEHDSGLKR